MHLEKVSDRTLKGAANHKNFNLCCDKVQLLNNKLKMISSKSSKISNSKQQKMIKYVIQNLIEIIIKNQDLKLKRPGDALPWGN